MCESPPRQWERREYDPHTDRRYRRNDHRRLRLRGRPGPREGRPIDVEQTVTDPDYVYVPENDTVRYPATKSGGEVSRYGYEPFHEWAYTEGAFVASRTVRDRLLDAFPGESALAVGVSAAEGHEGDLLDVVVTLRTHYDPEGETVAEPEVAASRVVGETPYRVETTLHFADRTTTDRYRVFVDSVTIQND